MSLLEEILKKSIVTNTKGGEYYDTTYNANLNMFSMLSRNQSENEVTRIFSNAYSEDKELALANLLYLLDIRDGKGERRLFKICFKWLCKNGNKEHALQILEQIGELGRWDYILVGIDTNINKEVINLIDKQLTEDLKTEYPSLLAKWLPTRRRPSIDLIDYVNRICKGLRINRKQYRKILVTIRKKLNLIETKLASKDYEIDFEKVPTKAMLKYKKAFARNCGELYSNYLEKANKGETKINTKGLFAYEIVKNIMNKYNITSEERNLYNAMWEQQKDVLKGYDGNILVMADTSGSMTWGNNAPIYSSIGLAIYIAERNKGIFKDYFMTFSNRPKMQKVIGNDIVDKIQNIKCIYDNTDIDKTFELLLQTAKENEISQEEMPSHIIIISDMEFDIGVYSKQGTNLKGWQKEFERLGYKIPKIIFWNVTSNIKGLPATKFENDVALISGFSTTIFENLLNLENLTPINVMISKLEKYIKILRGTYE